MRTLAGLALGLAPAAAFAEAWLLEPSMSVGVGYDDNVELVTDDPVEASVGLLSVGLDLRRITETLEVRGGAQLDYRAYAGDSDVPDNEDAQLLELETLARRPSGEWRFDGRFRRDTTAAEVQQVELSEETGADVDAGLVEEDVRRHRLSLAPSWRRQLTERYGVGLSYTGIDLNYEDSRRNDLEDSRVHQVGGLVDYALSERSTVGLRLEHILFRPEDSAEVDAHTLSGVMDHQLSPRTTLSGFLGVSYAEDQNTEESETGFVGQLSMRHRAELWRSVLLVERQLLPSGLGRLDEVNQLVAGVERDVSERSRIGLQVRVFDAEPVGDGNGNAGREYLRISPTWTWRLTRTWEIGARYEYRWVEREGQEDSASRNAVMLSLRYRPLRYVP